VSKGEEAAMQKRKFDGNEVACLDRTRNKPASPQLNGKVERSHRTDEQEFHQLLTYTDDVDLRARLCEWEQFYNLSRPHGAFNGKAPYEVLRERL
jgi:transposase InsO family protein